MPGIYRTRPWGLRSEDSTGFRPPSTVGSSRIGYRGRNPQPGWDDPSDPYGRVDVRTPDGYEASVSGDGAALVLLLATVLGVKFVK